MRLHELAKALNADLLAGSAPLFDMLSVRGRRAFFPSKGILGQSAEAKGKEINATIGVALEEDGSPLALDCVADKLNLPKTALLYSPSSGVKEMRELWKEMESVKNPSLKGKNFSLPVATHALTHGLFVVGQLFLDKKDKVISPDLYWDNYELVFGDAAEAELQTFPTFTKSGAFNAKAMAQLLEEPGEKKVVLLNFPNNPTGYTATEKDAKAIRAAILKAAKAGKKIVAVLDDAYFGLVYEEGVCRESLFAQLCDLHPNVLAVKVDGATKEDYVWGLRLGFITYGAKDATPAQLKALEQKTAGIVRGTISNPTNLGQRVLLKALASPEYQRQKQEKFATLKARYDKIKSIFAAHPEFSKAFIPMPFNSGYFMCVKPIGADAEAVRRQLLEKHGTGVIVLSGLLRIAFSSVPLDKLERLYQNINDAIRELQK